jgi:hypothetical protein
MKNKYPVNLYNLGNQAGHGGLRAYYQRFLLFPLLLSVQIGMSQTYSPGLAGKFGIDADMISNARTQGTFTGAGSHDWFKFGTGTGIGIFDTVGAAAQKVLISAGQNYSFAKPMQYSRYSIQDGTIQMDALYVRDYFGLSTHVNNHDRTAYIAANGISNKNNQDPSTWSTQVGPVPNKVDLIDVYLNMSRQGNSLNSASPSPLFLYVGASTIGTAGDRYLDFELFKNGVNFNSSTGLFSNVGPAITGGRNAWTFNSNGSLNQFGELTISFSFNSTVVTDIAIYIWLSYSTYTTVVPAGFDFVPGSWTGLNPIGGYGYVKIRPKAGNSFQAWGAVNTANLSGPAWGTNSASAGMVQNQYYSPNYTAGQFAEGAINLTSIGLDPLFSSTPNCEPPFERIMAKSRSSADFNSDLQDFIAPTAFLGVPIIPADITPASLTCSAPSISLSPLSTISGANYSWTTTNGNIVSGANTANPVIDAPGTYSLSASVLAGCTTTTRSITIARDTARPVASVTYLGQLTSNPNDSVTLKGGDSTASKQNNSFPSAGLSYSWIGPNGFASSQYDAKTNAAGTYTFSITEARNGCRAQASVTIAASSPDNTLPIHITQFSAVRNEYKKPVIRWSVASSDGLQYFLVQRSSNGVNFHDIKKIEFAQGSESNFHYTDHSAANEMVFYRVKAVSLTEAPIVTNVVKVDAEKGKGTLLAYSSNASNIVINYSSDRKEMIRLEVFTDSGQKIVTSQLYAEKGANQFTLHEVLSNHRVYFIRLSTSAESFQAKMVR